jgi:hypothetical protein
MARNLLTLLGAGMLVVGLSGAALAQNNNNHNNGNNGNNGNSGNTGNNGNSGNTGNNGNNGHHNQNPVAAPEIDLASAASALTLLTGGALVIRGRRVSSKL